MNDLGSAVETRTSAEESHNITICNTHMTSIARAAKGPCSPGIDPAGCQDAVAPCAAIRLEVHETRRQKYPCGHCRGAVVGAQVPVLAPIPKSMASASLLAYLIVNKFADGLPLPHRRAAGLPGGWLDNTVHSVLPKTARGKRSTTS